MNSLGITGTIYFFNTYPVSGSPALSLSNGESGGLNVTTAEMVIQFPSNSAGSYTARLLNPDGSIIISYYVPSGGDQQRVNNEVVEKVNVIAIEGQYCRIVKA